MECISLSSISGSNCIDTDNRAGLANCILLGFADEVGTWPKLPLPGEDPLSMEQAGIWNGDLAMKNGCHLIKVNITDETGELKITEQGEKGGKSFLYELELSRAKMNATMFGFENAIKDRKLVILMQDRNGTWYLMGDEMAPAMKVDGDGSTTGKAGTDKNSTSLKFQYTCPRKLIYTGEIESLIKAAEESAPDHSDTDTYTIIDIGQQIHSTGNTDRERYFMLELDDPLSVYTMIENTFSQGKIPVVKGSLQYGVRQTNFEVEIERETLDGNYFGECYPEGNEYVVVQISENNNPGSFIYIVYPE